MLNRSRIDCLRSFQVGRLGGASVQGAQHGAYFSDEIIEIAWQGLNFFYVDHDGNYDIGIFLAG